MKILSTKNGHVHEAELTVVERATSDRFETLLDVGHGITVAAYLAMSITLAKGMTLDSDYVDYLSENTLLLSLSDNLLPTSVEAHHWLTEAGYTPGERPFMVIGTTFDGDEIEAVGPDATQAMEAYDEAEQQAAMIRRVLAEECRPQIAADVDLEERRPGIPVPPMVPGLLVHPEHAERS